MLHIKSQGQPPSGSEEEGFLPYMGMAAILVKCDQDNLNKLLFPHPKESPYEL